MKSAQELVTQFEYGVKLKEDSSRDFIERDANLKLICRKIGPENVEHRLIGEEFELLQKMTSTKKNQERMLFKKYFKKFYGVGSKDGPYRVNAGRLTSHGRRGKGNHGRQLPAREHDQRPFCARRQEQLHRHAKAHHLHL